MECQSTLVIQPYRVYRLKAMLNLNLKIDKLIIDSLSSMTYNNKNYSKHHKRMPSSNNSRIKKVLIGNFSKLSKMLLGTRSTNLILIRVVSFHRKIRQYQIEQTPIKTLQVVTFSISLIQISKLINKQEIWSNMIGTQGKDWIQIR